MVEVEKTYPEVSPLLKRLLSAHQRIETKDIFETLPLSARAAAPEPSGHVGQRIGPYELIESLGAGGMGSVWRARQVEGALQREVALKFPGLHAHAGSIANIKARFARERDFLAALEHPNIARLYDAGVAADGQPYFAMELVRGLPIDAYCSEHQLTVAQRLALFAQVLRAVAFAHQRLILHRDLKPGNVLVDAQGQVRLLDFGVAKLLPNAVAGEQGAVATPSASDLTEMAGAAITLSYAAPEQITKGELTTATDVYALGVLLYRLLTGCSPYAPKRDSRGAMEEAVLSEDIAFASTRSFDAPHLTAAQASAPQLKKQLAGDIDTILAKALKKLPSARYESATALADDLQRHSALQPIRARPDSLNYRATRFFARNRLAVIASTVAVSALVATTGVAVWQAGVANANAARANREAARVATAQKFMSGLFANADPEQSTGDAITAREILERGLATAERELANDPESLNQVFAQIGDIYFRLGLSEKNLDVQRRREKLVLSHPQIDLDTRVEARLALGVALMNSADPVERNFASTQLRAIYDSTKSSALRADLRVLNIGLIAEQYRLERKLNQAQIAADEALALAQKTLPNPSAKLAFVYDIAANVESDRGQFSQARLLFDKAIAIDQTGAGRGRVDQAGTLTNLANLEYHSGDYLAARARAYAVLKLSGETLGELGGNLSAIRRTAVFASERAGDIATAQRDAKTLLAPELASRDPMRVATAQLALARIAITQGNFDDADDYLEQSEPALSAHTTWKARHAVMLAELLLRQGEAQDARDTLQSFFDAHHAELDASSNELANLKEWLAVAQARLGLSELARSSISASCAIRTATRADSHPQRIRCEAYQVMLDSTAQPHAQAALIKALSENLTLGRKDRMALVAAMVLAQSYVLSEAKKAEQFPLLD